MWLPRSSARPALAMDTSDTADIAATYADAGGGYRNGSHDVDIPSGRAPVCVVTHPTLDRLVRAREKSARRWSAAARSA